jgi:hypothetical protein
MWQYPPPKKGFISLLGEVFWKKKKLQHNILFLENVFPFDDFLPKKQLTLLHVSKLFFKCLRYQTFMCTNTWFFFHAQTTTQ